MPAISDVIVPSTSYPTMGTGPTTLVGDPFKGDGYYGWGDGTHTVQIELANFIGSINIQGTLAASPGAGDWVNIPLSSQDRFSVDTTGLVLRLSPASLLTYVSATTSVTSYNFVGNFIWIRANVTNWTQGTITQILLNH